MDAAQGMQLVADALGEPPLSATYQDFGHNSVTYDVALPTRNVIVRTNHNAQVFAKTERNLAILRELGLPVPVVLFSDLTQTRVPFAYMILAKIPGRDLRYELAGMTAVQMTRLAEQIVGFQRRVIKLPPGMGYGYVAIGEQGPCASWWQLLRPDHNEQSADATACRLIDEYEKRVLEQARRYEAYLRQVPPTCFLDDVTVKNVIVQSGELQGLVDFDCVCYGDPMYWMALTAVGVVSDVGTKELFYVEELKRLWRLTAEQESVLAMYSAGIALDFLRRFAERETPAWKARMLAFVSHRVA